MSITAEGVFFQDKVLTPQSLGALGAAALEDGVLTGCGMSLTGKTLNIGEGFIIVWGRVAKVNQGTLEADANGVVYADVNTEAAEPVTLDFASSAERGGNINIGSETTTRGIIATINGGKIIQRPARGTVMLWENSGTSMAGGTAVSVPGLKGFDNIVIELMRSNDEHGDEFLTQAGLYLPSTSGEKQYTITQSVAYDETVSGNPAVMRQRNITFDKQNETVTFSTGYYHNHTTDENDTSSGTLVPLRIWGVR